MLALATNDENTMNLRTLLLSTLLASNIAIADETPLTLDVYNADSNSFHVNATLVYGRTDAILIDTGFTKADALRIAAKVIDSGKQLKTIFISQADPDYRVRSGYDSRPAQPAGRAVERGISGGADPRSD